MNSEKEIEVLDAIYNSRHVKQRDIAEILGISLGMTNAILKRLVKKGFLSIKKINNRNILYAVTPAGIDELTHRSFRYFKRTIKNVVHYREKVETIVHGAKKKGFKAIVLVGASDLDFIIEHACRRSGLDYINHTDSIPANPFYIYSERYIPDKTIDLEDKVFLQQVFL